MQLGIVIGNATSTIKHASLQGWRMLIVQMVGNNRQPEGDPAVAFAKLSPGMGQIVILNSDGQAAREMIGDEKSPVRWFVIGIED